jgi:hypothetical protein
LLVRDSVGQVCGLFNSFGWSFVPIFNFAELNEAGTASFLAMALWFSASARMMVVVAVAVLWWVNSW